MISDISVITPSFKQLAFLKLCAASVADQCHGVNVEHLIEDGGTGEDFSRWANCQTFAKCNQESDRGMYDAINRGFAKAGGTIFAWLNCDEQYLLDTLQKVHDWFLENPDKDILFGDVILTSMDGMPLAYRRAMIPMRKHIRTCFLSTYSAATFVRRRVIEDGHFLDIRFRAIADAVWIDELLAHGYRAGILNEPLATFTQTGTNLGQSAKAADERMNWQHECGIHSRWTRMQWNAVHRIRKLIQGAYRTKSVEISIYQSGHSTRQIKCAHVGERWRTVETE